MQRFMILCVALTLGMPPVQAGLASKAARETAEFLMKKFGKEVAEEGAERLVGRIAKAAARHGDDVFAAVRKVGPKALGLADDAAHNGPAVLRFLARHGDDGLRVLNRPNGLALFSRFGEDGMAVLVKHNGVAAPLIETLGEGAVKAFGAVGAQTGRKMVMMSGDLAKSPGLVNVIARFGEPAAEFIWKNKGILAGGAALTAFLANPEPYLSGANALAETAGNSVVKPTIAAAGDVAVATVSFAKWVLLFSLAAGAGAAFLVVKCGGGPVVKAFAEAALRKYK